MLKFALPISPPSKIQGLVAGNFSDGGGEEIPIIYPATGEQISWVEVLRIKLTTRLQ